MEEIKKEVIETEEIDDGAVQIDEIIEMTIESIIDRAIDRVFEKLAEKKSVTLKSAVSGETGRETPDKRVDFSKLSYSELCSFLENHPKARI
jgi:hypothetical protein